MADSKKILFWPDVYKEQGHWLPTLAWADFINFYGKLANGKNFEIQYMGIADCEEIVENFETTHPANGDENKFNYNKIFTEIYREGYTNEVQTTPSSRWKPDHVWVLAYSGLNDKEREKISVSDKESREAEVIRDLFKSYSPDILVSGYFTALETLIIYYNRKRSSKFPDNLKFAISTTYLRHPYEDPASRALQNLMAFSPEEQKKLLNIVVHDCYDPKKLLNDPGITLEEFVAPLREFPEFIPCPKIFDYDSYSAGHGNLVQYDEPCITKELEAVNDSSLEMTWSNILNKPNLIYVTAGSQVLDYAESSMTLFKSIINAMQASDMKDYHLILCVGSTLIQEKWEDHENVTVCGWAPQRRILKALSKKNKTSCAIIYGGLATIKECIYYEVPFLVLPLGKDQMDNALRLEDCGIKNRFHIEYIKPKCLRYFINQVIQDYTSLRNLKKLSSIFRNSEDLHLGARKIAHLTENENLTNFNPMDESARAACSQYNEMCKEQAEEDENSLELNQGNEGI